MSSTPPPAPVAIGELVAGKYRVERVLGRGGMGVVVAAMHEQLAQRVAIKMLLPEAEASPNALARFTREARAAATIRGEHVARVLDVGEMPGGAPYIVMEYLEGRDLAQVLADRGTLPPDEAVAFVLQACEAIAEAHAAGIIHRDLKPSNIFVTTGPDGSPLVKVLDFGISKALLSGSAEGQLTTTSSFVGSPVYSPPEQLVRAHDADARADIWSLGTILFEALAGRPPFVGESVMHVASKIFNDAATPLAELRPDLPPELCAVVMRCLRKLPDERFPDVSALAQALAPFAPAHSVSADRVARIVAASLPPSQITALADTIHDSSKVAGSGETPHALVSARTPPPAPSRRWVVVAVASALGGATLVVILALGRAPAVTPRPMVPPAASGAEETTVLALPRTTAAEETPVLEAVPSASASASASATPHAPPPTPTKRNPLSVGVK
ncbi:MAG TPA: serine/threonine-protein kinase [Polyangiaceae bacterium]|jgi:serine/threonine-protein kinase